MRRFVIVSMGRTGSTMLVGLLNSHPEIECQGEIISPHGKFSKHDGMSRTEFLERHAYDTEKPIKGFKMPFDWVILHAGIFEDLRALGYRAIRLRRHNVLKHFISSKLAGANRDHSSQREYKMQAITIKPWEFVSFIGYVAAAEKTLDAMISGLEVFPIVYENLLNRTIHNQLCDFLGASPHALTPRTVRARTKSVNEAVTNYDELSELFRDSPFAHLWPPTK